MPPVPPAVARTAAVAAAAVPVTGRVTVPPQADGPVPSGVAAPTVADGTDPGRARSLVGGVEAVRGARSEIRRQMREKRRLRLGALVMATLLVLGALPLYFGVRAASHDPVFTSLDQLDVPSWAATRTVDDVSGSRWCLIECRLRERTSRSERPPEQTAPVYVQALTAAGWQPWKAPLCPEQKVDGFYSCWKRDELTLDLWVRKPTCGPMPGTSAAPDARAIPTPGQKGAPAEDCTGSQVSLKVRNAIDDVRTRPQPSPTPSF